MTPPQWLEHMRTSVGANQKFSVSKDALEHFLSRIPAESREASRAVWMSRYDKTIGQIQDEQLQGYLRSILPLLREDEAAVAEKTFIGIFPTHEFDAYVGETPRGDRVILLHEGLPRTFAHWAHWFTRAIIDEGGNLHYLDADRKKHRAAVLHMLSVWLGNRWVTDLPDIHPTSDDGWGLSESLALSAITFAIGHELGHVLRGHSDYTNDQHSNHEMEFQADEVGFGIALRQSVLKSAAFKGDNYYTQFMLFGPLLAIATLSLFGDTDSPTHPSASRRQERLLQQYIPQLRSLFARAKRTAPSFDELIQELNSDLEGTFARNCDQLMSVFRGYRQALAEVFDEGLLTDNTLLIRGFRRVDRLVPGKMRLR